MDIKKLQELARACRKLGITHFKAGDLDITLTEQAPPKRARRRAVVSEDIFEDSDGGDKTPSDMDMLLWSSAQ